MPWRVGKRIAAGVLVAALVGGGVAVAHELRTADAGTLPTVAAPAATAPADCVGAWNRSGNAAAPALAGLGQDVVVRIAHVRPLPGTLMRGRPCAVVATVPGTAARGVWVDGVEGQAGFVDVAGYPAARRYPAPRTAADGNATVAAAGTLTPR